MRVVLVEFGERHDKRKSWTLRVCYGETAALEFIFYFLQSVFSRRRMWR